LIPINKDILYTIDIEVKPLSQYENKCYNKNIQTEDNPDELHIENANFYPWTSQIYGMSVAWGYNYEDTAYFKNDEIEKVIIILSENKLKLGAHNVFYDWSNIAYNYEKRLNFVIDSGVISQCLNNSDFITSFGLKQTTQRQYNIETQDIEIKNYLKTNFKIAESKYGAFIHLCPDDMIEKYCRLDSMYCWRLIHDAKKWLKSDISQYMAFYMNEVEMTIIQFMDGILIDKNGLKSERFKLQSEINEIEDKFLNNEILKPYIEKIQDERFQKAQSKFKKKILDKEIWLKENKFNINSTDQLKQLFDVQGLHFDKIKNKFIYPYVNKITGTKIDNPNSPKLGTKFLYLYGIGGEILADKSEKVTLASHMERALEESELTGRLHAHINLLGTKSGRISGSGANIIAAPISDKVYGKNLIVEDGWIVFAVDFKSLEPTILACLSNDPVLKYTTYEGEGKLPFIKDGILFIDDIYISAAYSAPFMKSEIEDKLDYDNWVINPDAEKSKIKIIRGIAKTTVLSTNYGAGALKVQGKIREDMKITVPLKNIQIFQTAYWATFNKAAQYKLSIENEAKERGYLINIGGFPLIFYDRIGGIIQGTHKALNRMIQSSAAVVMKLFLFFLYKKIKNKSYVKAQICDLHDAFFGKCKIEAIDEVKSIINEALMEVNNTLSLPLKFRLDFNYGTNFYEAKG
jgi:DNA polymerase I-like protein with 3'-5' exonuclease and polymerase domains